MVSPLSLSSNDYSHANGIVCVNNPKVDLRSKADIQYVRGPLNCLASNRKGHRAGVKTSNSSFASYLNDPETGSPAPTAIPNGEPGSGRTVPVKSSATSSALALPDCFGVLRRRQEAELQRHGTREFIKVLRLLEHATLPDLSGAVEYALSITANSADAVKLILQSRQEQPVNLFCLDGRPHLKGVHIPPPNLEAYRSLRVGA